MGILFIFFECEKFESSSQWTCFSGITLKDTYFVGEFVTSSMPKLSSVPNYFLVLACVIYHSEASLFRVLFF